MSDESMAVAVYEPQAVAVGMVRPLAGAADAARAIAEYEALKRAIIQPGDVQKINGRDFLKKAFWRRVAACFGLSLELVSEQRGFDEGGHLFYSVVYRAEAPNGRAMPGDGYCSTAEPGRGAWPEHNVRATAHTRAKNRAISDLVGGGEVSAEETGEYLDAAPAPAPRPAPPQRPAPARPANGNGDAFAALRLRALKAGITTTEDWEAACKTHAGSVEPARMTDDGKRSLVAYVEACERDRRNAERAHAEVPAEVLEHLPAGAGSH